ncbi:hypothetical protein GCM10025858_02250 [Alicyclobacillus sacchari]|uniref:cobaltochelatase CobT-related protein n=1 Tax=Alicyclobacillus sacchari TaxID=392010 RepID=UPI0023E9782A|nr:hypothetical protein [Alicyclobacillus sacchari]GMA55722.1 hypothetical protein GCM10025858_02250 [Alicyclobacillus sacchari]
MDHAEGAMEVGGGWNGRLGTLEHYEGPSQRGRIVGDGGEDASEVAVEAATEKAAISDGAAKTPRVIELGWRPPSPQATSVVRLWRDRTQGTKRRLLRAFYHSFWREQDASSGGFQYGRLGRRLERVATERLPRLFEHRQQKGMRFDAVVQVLVDCSGSMEPYLDACKPALCLLADTLRALHIPYNVCAFWEDSVDLSVSGEGETATLLWDVIPFARSQSSEAALALADLEPQLDNRDGVAIRLAANKLCKRRERQKWLFVVSDGQRQLKIIATRSQTRNGRYYGRDRAGFTWYTCVLPILRNQSFFRPSAIYMDEQRSLCATSTRSGRPWRRPWLTRFVI